MHITRILAIIAVLCSCTNSPAQSESFTEKALNNVLDSLDEVIDSKEKYAEAWLRQTENIKNGRLHPKGSKISDTYWILYERYRRVQTDSALYYLNELQKLPEITKNPDERMMLQISLADIYGVTGLYTSSLDILQNISTQEMSEDVRIKYYHTVRTIYGWLTDYTSNEKFKTK